MSNSVCKSHHETSSHSITKRIGQTTYIIRIHYSEDSKETVSEKLLRIIKADADATDGVKPEPAA